MTRRTGLKRGTPMPCRHAPMRQRATPKPGESAAKTAGQRVVKKRSKGLCEIRIPGVCFRRAGNWHHRKNGSVGGTWCPSSGLHLCGSGTTGCHGAVTDTQGNRAEYERLGWIVPSWRDPARTRVWYRQERWVHLHPDGRVTNAPNEDEEEEQCRTTT